MRVQALTLVGIRNSKDDLVMELGWFGHWMLCLAWLQPECIFPGAGGEAGEALVRVNLASASQPGQKKGLIAEDLEEWRSQGGGIGQ